MGLLALQCRAVIFDMDGTIVDSRSVVEAIWSSFAARFGHDRDAVLASIHGIRAEESISRYAPAGVDQGLLAQELSDYEHAHSDQTLEVPGARAFLAALPADAIGLVTSSPPPLVAARMAGAGLDLFRTMVTADDVERGKPAPDGFLLAAQRLGVAPADVVVFEDADAGVRAARAAGMRVVVVGDHAGPAAAGLPTIPDYRGAAVAVDGTVITLTLPATSTSA